MPAQLIAETFQGLGIDYQVIEHRPLVSADEADGISEEYNIPSQKSLILRNKKKTKYWMFTVLGGQKTDLRAIGDLVGDRVSFANPEELKTLLNVEPGSCSPFGLLFDTENRVEFWIQEELLEYEYQGFHPNDNTKTWKITTDEFKAFIQSLGRELKTVKF